MEIDPGENRVFSSCFLVLTESHFRQTKEEVMSVKRVAVMLSMVLCGAGVAMAETEWVEDPDNPILGPGEPGAWDDGGSG